MAAPETVKRITAEQQQELDEVFARARKALAIIETYDQARVDRLCQAVAWAVANKQTFTRLVDMGIEESGLGDAVSRMGKRMKIRGVLRDALRQKSVGIIEELPEKGIVKYGKPAGIIACIVPTTNPDLTPAGNAIYGIKARDVRDLLAAPALEEDLVRDRAADARGAGARRRAGRHPAVPDQGQHPDVAGADGARRPDRRHRRPADGPRRVQLGHAGLRRGRRQLDDDHRRDREHRGSRAQHAAVQDLRLRLRLLGRRQPDHRGVDLRQAARPAAEGRRLPRHARGEGDAAPGDVGRRAPPHRRDRRDRAAAAREDRRLRDPGRPQVHHRPRRRHRQGAPLLRREAHDAARRLQVQGLRPGARHDARRLRGRRQGPLLRHLLVRPGPHPPRSRWRRRCRGSWSASRSRRPTPARSTTGCR